MAYHLLMESARMTKEEVDSQDKVRSRLRGIEYEAETGMPAITQWMAPADEMYERR